MFRKLVLFTSSGECRSDIYLFWPPDWETLKHGLGGTTNSYDFSKTLKMFNRTFTRIKYSGCHLQILPFPDPMQYMCTHKYKLNSLIKILPRVLKICSVRIISECM
jgi:hypothetical protein